MRDDAAVIHGVGKEADGLFAPACKAHCLQYTDSVQGDDAPVVKGYTHAQVRPLPVNSLSILSCRGRPDFA
eukprot:COSAG06_NODE_770_length_12437_cov_27.452423_7_plen_71_part_00